MASVNLPLCLGFSFKSIRNIVENLLFATEASFRVKSSIICSSGVFSNGSLPSFLPAVFPSSIHGLIFLGFLFAGSAVDAAAACVSS